MAWSLHGVAQPVHNIEAFIYAPCLPITTTSSTSPCICQYCLDAWRSGLSLRGVLALSELPSGFLSGNPNSVLPAWIRRSSGGANSAAQYGCGCVGKLLHSLRSIPLRFQTLLRELYRSTQIAAVFHCACLALPSNVTTDSEMLATANSLGLLTSARRCINNPAVTGDQQGRPLICCSMVSALTLFEPRFRQWNGIIPAGCFWCGRGSLFSWEADVD